jgi:2-oxoisovalerate dehydrogenase E1 component
MRWPAACRCPTVMAEMYGKAEGCSGGRGGSMHLFDAATNFYGGNAIVGGGLPLAGGLALATRMRGEDRVTACFFGEGAVAEGEFHETMNLAELWDLPVLFVCENNGYAMGTAMARTESETDIHAKAAAYGIASEASTAWTWSPSRPPPAAPSPASARPAGPISSNAAPIASARIRCSTRSSTATRTEIASWREKGPIVRFQGWLLENHLIHDSDIARDRGRSRCRDRRSRGLCRGRNLGAGGDADPPRSAAGAAPSRPRHRARPRRSPIARRSSRRSATR